MTLVAPGPERDLLGRADWRAIFRLGTRELRSGLKGFQVFIACLALGVMVIAAVGALADGLRSGFEKQGQSILGGDMTFARMHARATPAELSILRPLGSISETATMRTMARRLDGADQALAELKSVDSNYPLSGSIRIEGDGSFASALEGDGVVADSMLLDRLGVKVGERFKIGSAELIVRGILKAEPDAVADRLTYGPRIFVSLATLQKTGLVQPGTLIRWRYAIKQPLGAPGDAAALKAFRTDVERQLPDAGFTSADRHDPSPQITRTLDRLRQFLILVGLAALLVGGVGIANAVSTFVDKRVKTIATLRSLGASGLQIIGIFLVQILAMSAIGIGIGLALGVLVPAGLDRIYGDVLPVHTDFNVSLRSLWVAGLYGILVAMLFAIWPLGRVENVRANVLFRESIPSVGGWPRPAIVGVTAILLALLLALALLTSEPRHIALYVAGGLVLMLAVFSWLGTAMTRAAQTLPRPASPTLALAIRNIGAPDGLTKSVVLSIGTGLSLLVAVALANSSMVAELKGRLPDQSPDYFLLDIAKQDYDALSQRILAHVPGAVLTQAPMLRGRLVRLKGKPVEDIKAPPEAQWVLNGDRGLSFTTSVPEGSTMMKGEWWQPGYDGPPLVSFEADLAKKLGLAIGDQVTVNVLGRNIDATISNLREVKWETIGINFVMLFSPNTLQAAPYNLLATIRLPKGIGTTVESDLVRDLGRAYPSVSAIRVRDAIDQFNKVFSKVMTAVRVASSVTLIAGALVLAGALATAQRRRTLEAVILKTIGARRRQILAAHAWEYALLAGLAALVAIAIGTLVAWAAVTRLMELNFVFSLNAVLQTLAFAFTLIAVFGGLGTWAILRAPTASSLRSE